MLQPGVSANISTRDGDVVTDEGAATSYTIDTSCGDTIVTVKNGQVELRSGGAVKKISALAGAKKRNEQQRLNRNLTTHLHSHVPLSC